MPITKQALENAATLGLRPERFQILEDMLHRYIEQDRIQALVVKATRHGFPIFEGTYGRNTKEYGVRMDTIFPVASNTKPIIATLLLILQEDGLLDLTEPVWHYLPEFHVGGRENICLWHFLTHTSGLRDEEIWPAMGEYAEKEMGLTPPPDDETTTHEEWVAFAKKVCAHLGIEYDPEERDRLRDPEYIISLKLPVNNAPRSHMTYCNYGYQRLKDVIDVVTGESIDDFAQRRLFHPLGMLDTYWRVPREKWPRILGRSDRCTGVPWINSENNYLNESGSGGLKTTVEDITRFMRMILGGGILDGVRILSKASVREMLTNQNNGVPSNGDVHYSSWGLGWNIRGEKKDDVGNLRSPACLDHGGWAGAKIVCDPETGLTLAIYAGEYEYLAENKEFFNYLGPITNVIYSAFD